MHSWWRNKAERSAEDEHRMLFGFMANPLHSPQRRDVECHPWCAHCPSSEAQPIVSRPLWKGACEDQVSPHLSHSRRYVIRDAVFVTPPDRKKNKDALALSVATDKNIEKASVIALLHSTLSHWNDARGCEEVYLHNPRPMCLHEEKVSKSVSATLTCGDVYTHDMVLLFDGSIGKVLSFRQHDDSIHVGVQVHRAIPNAELLFGIRVHEVNFVDDRSTVEPIFWYAKANAILATSV